MEWKHKSECSEMYCAVHNVDCPLHGHSGDPWVLSVDPTKLPEAWICPQAVTEIADFSGQAHDYRDKNEELDNPYNSVDEPLLGEIVNNEIPYWGVGVCTVNYDSNTDEVAVHGESGLAQTFDLSEYRDSPGGHVDLVELKVDVNTAIEDEHRRL